ncbi:MAG: hypothetical protein LBJ00_01250 [Planctomycetaceae bacterium]|nr:hypothetical protein [Planctomycetaceae bacterium]
MAQGIRCGTMGQKRRRADLEEMFARSEIESNPRLSLNLSYLRADFRLYI